MNNIGKIDPHFPLLSASIAEIPPGNKAKAPETYDAAIARYADEMLPAILGGEWKRSSCDTFSLLGIRAIKGFTFGIRVQALFDHQVGYRICGAKGPHTWKNCVLLGQPYHAFDRRGEITSDAKAIANQLKRIGVAVWVRRDLSAWFPGATQLVLASPRLMGKSADQFGFVAIGDADESGSEI